MRRKVWIVIAALLAAGVGFNHLVDLSPTPVFTDASGQRFPGYSAEGALQQPSKDDVAAVERDLDARARAVLTGDEAAFLGTLDTDRQVFMADQRTVWGNTRRLPFAMLSYSYDGVLEPDQPFTSPAFLVRVTTTYELRGYDRTPVQSDAGYTFVEQHGAWKLAAVSDADRQFSKDELPLPWDGRPISTVGDADFLVVVDRGKTALARRILALCHHGSSAARRLLGAPTPAPTVILATTQASSYRRFVGLDFLAVTYPLRGPEGVTPGWRVFVNPHQVAEVAASPVTLPHELTHLATQDYLAVSPRWLVEGAAEYVGWHGSGGLAAELKARGVTGVVWPDQLPSSRTFYRRDIQLSYAEGTALVSWLEEHEGRGAVLTLMRAYDAAGGYDISFDPDKATPGILSKTFGLTPAALAHAAFAGLDTPYGS